MSRREMEIEIMGIDHKTEENEDKHGTRQNALKRRREGLWQSKSVVAPIFDLVRLIQMAF